MHDAWAEYRPEQKYGHDEDAKRSDDNDGVADGAVVDGRGEQRAGRAKNILQRADD